MTKKAKKKVMLKNIEIAVLAILIVSLLTLIIYMVFVKKDDNSINLTNDEALSIAKSKLNEAQFFYNSFENESKDKLTLNEYFYGDFYYFDTEENFNKKFKNIYSNDVRIKNFMIKYVNGEFETYNTDGDEGLAIYLVKDNKIYVNYECRAGGIDGLYARDYRLISNDNDKIEVLYKIYMDYEDYSKDSINPTQDKYQDYLDEQKEYKLKIVREDNEWKISKATILDACGMTLNVSSK